MNLLEAIKSGKRFSREKGIVYPAYGIMSSGNYYSYSHQDVIADNWELEKEPEVIEWEMPVAASAAQQVLSYFPIQLLGKRWKFVATEIIE